MICDDARKWLDEYHDRELPPDRSDAVRVHLAGCAGCAAELRSLEALDRTLRAAPVAAEGVSWDGYADRVRNRARGARPPSWKALVPLAAAALLVAVFARIVPSGPAPTLLDRYAAASPADRAEIEKSVAGLDREALAALIDAMVTDGDPARRILAARLARPRLGEPDVERLLLARSRELERGDAEETILVGIGFEPGDEELVAPALEMARSPAHFDDAVRILRRLDRGTINRKAHAEIVRRLRELLGSGIPRDRELAVRIAGELEILFEDIVEFLDVPDLGRHVLEFLRRRTGKDFGTDKAAWRAWFDRRS